MCSREDEGRWLRIAPFQGALKRKHGPRHPFAEADATLASHVNLKDVLPTVAPPVEDSKAQRQVPARPDKSLRGLSLT